MHRMQSVLLFALAAIGAILLTSVVDASYVRNDVTKDGTEPLVETPTNLENSEMFEISEITPTTSTFEESYFTPTLPTYEVIDSSFSTSTFSSFENIDSTFSTPTFSSFEEVVTTLPEATFDPEPETFDNKPEIFEPKPETFEPKPETTENLQLLGTNAPPSEFTSQNQETFNCGIIPTTVTVIHSKTKPGILAITATYITNTKTPTVKHTEFTSCAPECATKVDDVTETVTTALVTLTEMAVGCDNPPAVYSDTLTLFTTEIIPVRNTESVTITITPQEPIAYITSTYFINEEADKVIETEYAECSTPPPCLGLAPNTITKTLLVDVTTVTSSVCLENWSFYQATTTLTHYACFNPFSVYACPEGGSCPVPVTVTHPLPVTVTQPLPVAADTVTLTESRPCLWQARPGMTQIKEAVRACSVTVTVTEKCTALPAAIKPQQDASTNGDINKLYTEIEGLLEKLNDELKVSFPKEKVTVKIHIKILNKLSGLNYHPSLRALPSSAMKRLVAEQKAMIQSLRRYAKDEERVKADPEAFFSQLEDLVDFLEKQPGESRVKRA